MLAFIMLSLMASHLKGQEKGSIHGRVLDAAKGEPMQAVSIGANRSTGTTTDSLGVYRLDLNPGHYLIEFYYVGCETEQRRVFVAAGEAILMDIQLRVKSRMLDEVVVSAGKYEQKLADVTVSMEVLKPYQLDKQNILTLDMVLEKTPGISILDGQPSIRGGSGFSYGAGSRVLMLVDDLPMLSADAGDIKWDFMPVENMHQVEVIKGASSVLYGSSALNGAINLRTRFPANEPSTDITLFGGMYLKPRREETAWWESPPLMAGASVSHLRKMGNLDLSLGGNYQKHQAYRTEEYNEHVRGNLGLRYRFKQVEGLAAGMNISAMFMDKSDFLLWQDADSGIYVQNPSTVVPLTGYRYNIDPFLEYLSLNGDKHSLRSRLYGVGNDDKNGENSSFSKLWYAEYRYLNKIGSRMNWTSGASFSHSTVLAQLYEDHRGSNASIYSQMDAQLWPRVKLSTGVRWEMNALNGEVLFSQPVVRAGLNFRAAEATYLRSSFGQGYRFPTIAEKFATAELGGLQIFANPELEPERGWSTELGIKQGFAFANWTGFVDLALFWTEYDHMIEYTFGAYPPDSVEIPGLEHVGFKALNITDARINGVEISFSGMGSLGPVTMDLSGGYTLMNPVDLQVIRESGKLDDESHVLKYRRRHLVKTDLELGYWKLFAGVNAQFNSRMIRVDEVFVDDLIGNLLLPGFPEYWEEHPSSYALLDFRLGWQVHSLIRITVVLNNALNKEYLGRPGDIGPPRNLSLQAKVSF